MYYPSSENKDADQLRGSAPLFSSMQIVGFPMGRLKCLIFFLIFAQNIDCGVLTITMFWSKNKKNSYTPPYPSFAISMWGSRGYTCHGHVILVLIKRCWFLLFLNFEVYFMF